MRKDERHIKVAPSHVLSLTTTLSLTSKVCWLSKESEEAGCCTGIRGLGGGGLTLLYCLLHMVLRKLSRPSSSLT